MSNASFDTGSRSVLPPEMTVFAATLTPNRPLGRYGTALVVGFVALASAITAIPFVVAGAWPVGGFFGLDVLLLYLAFRVSSLRARSYEEVVLNRIELLLRKVGRRGDVQEWRFNPFWVRVRTEEDATFGVTGLAVVEGRREVAVGTCLGPAERREFADAFRRALAGVRS